MQDEKQCDFCADVIVEGMEITEYKAWTFCSHECMVLFIKAMKADDPQEDRGNAGDDFLYIDEV